MSGIASKAEKIVSITRRERAVEVGDAGMCDLADDLAGGGVENVDGLAARGIAPLAVDEKSGIGVARNCHAGSCKWENDRLRGARIASRARVAGKALPIRKHLI